MEQENFLQILKKQAQLENGAIGADIVKQLAAGKGVSMEKLASFMEDWQSKGEIRITWDGDVLMIEKQTGGNVTVHGPIIGNGIAVGHGAQAHAGTLGSADLIDVWTVGLQQHTPASNPEIQQKLSEIVALLQEIKSDQTQPSEQAKDSNKLKELASLAESTGKILEGGGKITEKLLPYLMGIAAWASAIHLGG